MNDYPEITNRNLTAIFDSFGIMMGDLNYENWVGKVGAAMIKHDENEYEKINYFIPKKNQDNLSSWVEPNSDEAKGEFITIEDGEDLPF